MVGHYSGLVDHIVKDHDFNGYKYGEMFSLAEHYGFVRRDEGNGSKISKHIFYTHPDYPDLHFVVSTGSGEVVPSKVEQIGKLCMEVRKRNAKGREKIYDKMPQWVLNSLPAGTCVENDNNTITFEAGGIVGIDNSLKTQVRRYEMALEGASLAIHNLDYPGHDTQFTIRDGIRHREESFLRVFTDLDADVGRHIEALTQAFNNRLERLQKNRGFEVTFTPLAKSDGRAIHLHHPLYHLDAHIEQPGAGGVITNKIIHQLEAISNKHDECFYEQLDLLQELNAQGWHINQTPSLGVMGELEITRAPTSRFTLRTYGDLEMFDMQALRDFVATTQGPKMLVSKSQHQGSKAPEKLPLADKIEAVRQGMQPRRA